MTFDRFSSSGWALLPLRGFLGVTFIYAGIQKLADPRFFDSADPTSINAQLSAFANNSPIGGLLDLAARGPAVAGLLIAFGELAVGLGVLLGLWTRLAAVGGALMSATFLLAVSWHTHPYYYGPDIISLFAFTPLILAGDGGVLSFHDALNRQADRIDLTDEERRQFIVNGTGAVAAAGVVAGVAGALLGRLLADPASRPDLGSQLSAAAATPTTDPAIDPNGTNRPATSDPATDSTGTSHPAADPATPPGTTDSTPAAPEGIAIGPASAVDLGSAAFFSDPFTGQASVVYHPTQDQFIGHSAICTHAGCRVRFQGETLFCPCHGATFDPTTGDVLSGPARRPLPPVDLNLGADGLLYAID
jgi:thiosulfate dehydrogenase [quinone] large subunit